MYSSVDSIKPQAITNLEAVDLTAPEMVEKDAELPALPTPPETSASESSQEMITELTMKRQTLNTSKFFKRSSFKMKKKMKK